MITAAPPVLDALEQQLREHGAARDEVDVHVSTSGRIPTTPHPVATLRLPGGDASARRVDTQRGGAA